MECEARHEKCDDSFHDKLLAHFAGQSTLALQVFCERVGWRPKEVRADRLIAQALRNGLHVLLLQVRGQTHSFVINPEHTDCEAPASLIQDTYDLIDSIGFGRLLDVASRDER